VKTCSVCNTQVSNVTRYCPICSSRIPAVSTTQHRVEDAAAEHQSEDRRAMVAAASVEAANRAAQDWLVERGIISPDMPTPERMRACSAFRAKIARAGRRKPSTEWASTLLREAEDGRPLTDLQRRLALASVGFEGIEPQENTQ
jgi:uncharacterized Zn finger protein (UPF0148 family)